MIVIPLRGIECHQCGKPATWWADDLTLPCLCGLRSREQANAVIAAVENWQQVREIQESRARAARLADEQRLARIKEEAEELRQLTENDRLAKAWADVLGSLTALAGTPR